MIIFTFHKVADDGDDYDFSLTTDQFKMKLIDIMSFYKIVPLSNLFSMHICDVAAVTFDDGLKCHYEIVAPILEYLGIKATFFIIAGFVGKEGYMSWDEIKKLQEAGHRIGCHTMTHPKIIDENNYTNEIITSTRLINMETGNQPEFLVVPYSCKHKCLEDVKNQILADYSGVIFPQDKFEECGNDALHLKSVIVKRKSKISSKEYWNAVYSGAVNAEPGGHESMRFGAVMEYLEGHLILDVGAGYAVLCKAIQQKFPSKLCFALDFSEEAKRRSGFDNYSVCSCYKIPFSEKNFDMVIACQVMEYLDDNDLFLREAQRVGKIIIVTVPEGVHKTCSQLRVYTEESLKMLMEKYCETEILYSTEGFIFYKGKFKEAT